MSSPSNDDPFSILQAAFITTLALVNKSTECDGDTQDNTDFLFGTLMDYKDNVASRTDIEKWYNTNFKSLNDNQRGRILGQTKDAIKQLLLSCKANTWANLMSYNTKYQTQFSSSDSNKNASVAEFDKHVAFTPTKAVLAFGLLNEKVNDDIQKCEGKKCMVVNSKDFADYLLRIAGFACGTMAYVGLCDIALCKYVKGDVEGCKTLMERVREYHIIKEIQDFNYVPDNNVE
ncbi:hypothetical protein H4219_005697 [Mycoemilia scoparia]|uniref:Uncharacterized protein n=1 Tax=Mycoemilia scoparia TaxID=417184 RepID=A0A9W7ZS75_9FUNG|nr:hypothetical protein H4219_005697 [Mycoemilia scoparia]